MPGEQIKQSLETIWPLYKRLFVFTGGSRHFIVLGCLLIAGIAVTNTMMIWLVGTPLNLLQNQQYDRIVTNVLLLGGIIVLNQGFHFSSRVLISWLELRFVGEVRGAMLERCMAVSFPVLDRHPRGDILTRLSGDLDKVAMFQLSLLFQAVSHLLIFLFYSIMLFWIAPGLALFAFICAPVFFLHQRIFGKRKQRVSQQFFAAGGKLLSYESETLSNLRGISSFNVARRVKDAHQRVFSIARDWAMKSKWIDALFETSLNALIYLGALIIIMIGIYRVEDGAMGIGDLVSFLLYLGYLSVPLRGSAQLALQAQEHVAAARRICEVLDLQPIVGEAADAPDLKVTNGAIEFRDVVFAYDDGIPILDHLNLSIQPHESVALVGPSGAGKTTFAKLLVRFYDPADGAITIDHQDIRQVSLASLRREIAVVWQDPFLINDTIRNNLLMARRDATEQQIAAACQSASATGFIEKLQHGLDTVIGANGVELSAGQKQRLAIAQAFLQDAPILLLDEASAALDSKTEQMIVESLDRLKQGRTTLMIAHRFSAIRSANRVVFFNSNGTVTVGTHQQLWDTHSAYRQAAEWQTARDSSTSG